MIIFIIFNGRIFPYKLVLLKLLVKMTKPAYKISKFHNKKESTMIIHPIQSQKSIYVYILKNPENSEILYIGYGKLPEIFTFQQVLKNPNFNASIPVEVIVLTPCKTVWEAVNQTAMFVRQLCPDHMPVLNLTQHSYRGARVQCIETGVIYKNAADASKSLGIPQPRLSNHLARKPGHKTIKGFSFQYV